MMGWRTGCIMRGLMIRTVLGVRGWVVVCGVVHLTLREVARTRSKVLVERVVRQLGEGRSSWLQHLVLLAQVVRGHQSVKERGFVIVIVEVGLAGLDDGEAEQEPQPHTQHVLVV